MSIEAALSAARTLLKAAIPSIRHEQWAAFAAEAKILTPPNDHVMPVSDLCSLVCGVLWLTSYIMLIRKSFKEESYGMPIYALCMNMCWESTYGFIYPPDAFNGVVFASWAVVDLFLFRATIKNGKREFAHAPIIADNLPLICITCCVVAEWALLSFCSQLIPVIGREVVFFSTWPCQIAISAGSIQQVLSRNSTRGHSLHIWWTRAVGTAFVLACFWYRAIWWPERFSYAASPLAVFFMLTSFGLDLVYPFAYLAVKRIETAAARKLAGKNGKAK